MSSPAVIGPSPTRCRGRRALLGAVLPCLLWPVAGGAETGGVRMTMEVIYAALRDLVGLSVDTVAFRDPARSEAIVASLGELRDQAAMLAEHASTADPEGEFLASTLDRYASWALRGYEWGEMDAARRMIQQMPDICIACHTRLPSRGDSPLAEDFLAAATITALPALERARLEVATRRFDDALATIEGVLESPGLGEAARPALRSYLVVSLRVKEDLHRPLPLLARLARREDLYPRLREDLGHWTESLRRARSGVPAAAALVAARQHLEVAESARFPDHRAALVEYVLASALLERYLGSEPTRPDERAEAYYLLGLAQYRIDDADWLPTAELLLEKAVLTAPRTAAARRAFTVLDEKVRAAFRDEVGGLPPEVAEHLAALRAELGPE